MILEYWFYSIKRKLDDTIMLFNEDYNKVSDVNLLILSVVDVCNSNGDYTVWDINL